VDQSEAARTAPATTERDPHVELKSGDRLNETLTPALQTAQAGVGSKIATCKNLTVATKSPTKLGIVLARSTFVTSRLADFASREELTRQIGHAPASWPVVILKELVDNALDECERAGVAPVITITVDADSISVSDNGDGIPAKTVKRILNYASRASSNAAYVSPTRGQQGNAMQTLLAMSHALTSEPGVSVIESRGVRHRVTFSIDPISREPRLDHQTANISAARGTKVTLFLPVSPDSLVDLHDAAVDFSWINPHLALSFAAQGDDDSSFTEEATESDWTKWKPTDPAPAHWYDLASLKILIAAEVNKARQDRSTQRTVSDFISEFRGLSGTAKRRDICQAVNASGAHLDTFFARGDAVIQRLLDAMKAASNPAKPRDLGVIGEDNVLAVVGGDSSERYKRTEVEVDGVPYLIEAGFGHRPEASRRTMVSGLNWSISVGGDPFRRFGLGQSLGSILSDQHAGPLEPIALFLHLASPRLTFLDKGKSAVDLPVKVNDAIVAAVKNVTAAWAKQRKAEERDRSARLRRNDAMTKSAKPMSIRDAAFKVMAKAYTAASDNGKLPANARQIYYAARPEILRIAKVERVDSKRFTQELLIDYMNDHPDECARWDVVFSDAVISSSRIRDWSSASARWRCADMLAAMPGRG
jgi:DNA topoisomerase VI subunit B